MPYALAGGTAGAVVGGGTGFVIGGTLTGGVAAIPTAIIGAKGGFTVGFMSTLAADAYAIEAGSMYLDLLDEGLDAESSRYIAAATGLVNAGLELIGLSKVTAPIKKQLTKQVTKQIAKGLTKPTVRSSLVTFSKNYFLNNTFEAITEMGQELSNIVGRDIAIAIQGKDLEKNIKHNLFKNYARYGLSWFSW